MNSGMGMERDFSETDVLIVGAGPSGLMAAQALARLNVQTEIIERRRKGEIYGNADALQPRTMEVFESYGIIDDALSNAAFLNTLTVYKSEQDTRRICRMPPGICVDVDSRFPYEATLTIQEIEGTLERSLYKHGGSVSYGTQPTSATLSNDRDELHDPNAYPITLTTEMKNGITRTIKSKFLLGCDGAHSWVRDRFGINMEGEKTEFIWAAIEGTYTTNFPDHRTKSVIQGPAGMVVFIPHRDNVVRIYVNLKEEDVIRDADGRIDMAPKMKALSIKRAIDRMDAALGQYRLDFQTITSSVIFAVAQRVATSFSVQNRVFIMGDASHTHSPANGQGANASMMDAHNIAWKLTHVLRGWAAMDLLDTFNVERRAYAELLINLDREVTHMLSAGDCSKFGELSARATQQTSAVGVHYNSILTPSTQSFTKFKAGYRLPPAPLTRLADWNPVDLQHLACSDGLWKMLLCASNVADLSEAAQEIASTKLLDTKAQVSVILDVDIKAANWMDVPEPFCEWQRVFSGSPPPLPLSPRGLKRSLFGDFEIPLSGALILVRPDGWISMVENLTQFGIRRAIKFLDAL